MPKRVRPRSAISKLNLCLVGIVLGTSASYAGKGKNAAQPWFPSITYHDLTPEIFDTVEKEKERLERAYLELAEVYREIPLVDSLVRTGPLAYLSRLELRFLLRSTNGLGSIHQSDVETLVRVEEFLRWASQLTRTFLLKNDDSVFYEISGYEGPAPQIPLTRYYRLLREGVRPSNHWIEYWNHLSAEDLAEIFARRKIPLSGKRYHQLIHQFLSVLSSWDEYVQQLNSLKAKKSEIIVRLEDGSEMKVSVNLPELASKSGAKLLKKQELLCTVELTDTSEFSEEEPRTLEKPCRIQDLLAGKVQFCLGTPEQPLREISRIAPVSYLPLLTRTDEKDPPELAPEPSGSDNPGPAAHLTSAKDDFTRVARELGHAASGLMEFDREWATRTSEQETVLRYNQKQRNQKQPLDTSHREDRLLETAKAYLQGISHGEIKTIVRSELVEAFAGLNIKHVDTNGKMIAYCKTQTTWASFTIHDSQFAEKAEKHVVMVGELKRFLRNCGFIH